MSDIIKDIDVLRDITKMEDCENQSEGATISKELFKAIASQKTAPAMSANQIGCMKRVIALAIDKPLYLINPVIESYDNIIPYIESHASFPQKLFTTLRYATIKVSALNLKEPLIFGIKPENRNLLYTNGKLNVAATTHPIIMEAVYIQQAVDSLNGILPMDRNPELQKPYVSEKTPNRNEIVTLVKDSDEIKIKYKRAKSYLDSGWTIKK